MNSREKQPRTPFTSVGVCSYRIPVRFERWRTQNEKDPLIRGRLVIALCNDILKAPLFVWKKLMGFSAQFGWCAACVGFGAVETPRSEPPDLMETSDRILFTTNAKLA